MAFLGISRKDDLRILATEMGLAPSGNLKIIELKDLIANSDRTAYLIGSMPPDIAQLIEREDEDDAQNYENANEMLLKRFRVTGDRFRQYFSEQKKTPDST
ncbi:hypothetical protein TNCV_4708011 [Trichonephila clavipes]|nr:hypothetical protein TNCV_4708011 [Trichonephila clavipes]